MSCRHFLCFTIFLLIIFPWKYCQNSSAARERGCKRTRSVRNGGSISMVWEKNNESLLFWAVPSTFLSFLSLKVMLKFIHLKEATRQEGLWGMEVFQCCGKEQTNPWSWCTMTSWTMQVYDMPKLLTSTLLATGGVGGDGGGPALTSWHTPPSCSTMMRSIQDLLAPSFLTRWQMASSASLSRLALCCHVFDLFDFVDRVKR